MRINKYIVIILLVVSATCIVSFFLLFDSDDIGREIQYQSNQKYGIAVIAIKGLARYLLLVAGLTIPGYLAYRYFFNKD